MPDMHEQGKPIRKDEICFEDLHLKPIDGAIQVVLPKMTPDQVDAVDPLIPPTSGIRLRILDKKDTGYSCPASKYTLFLRLFKAISTIVKEKLGRVARVIVTSDERPTSDALVKHALQILAFDGHELLVQALEKKTITLDQFTHSGMSTPYSSAAIAVLAGIDVVITVSASHNSATWNGIKFYFKQPIPVAGDLLKEISKKAIELVEIPLKSSSSVLLHADDIETRINDYVLDVIKHVIPIQGITGKPVVLWPYMGNAKEIHDLLLHYGVNVVKIEKTMEPPDPTVNLPIDEVKGYLERSGASLAILLDADRDRIVFIIKIGNNFVQLNPNELYTAMHNILARDYKKTIINVRTVPSDPRCDGNAACTIESGVGYKHLGMIQFVSSGIPVDKSQFESALIYGKLKEGRVKIESSIALLDFLGNNLPTLEEAVLMVLWEESGGHTMNLVKPRFNGTSLEKLEPVTPLIGDKFPAPAIILLAELINRGHDLVSAIDTSIAGQRVEIEADDKRKQAIMKAMEKRVGNQVIIGGKSYEVVDYRDNLGMLDIISFRSDQSVLFARPSGTGNSVRIYIFGEKVSGKKELENVADYLKNV
ncbi:MAG: hypothetical protein GYA24_21240 [Candidatus Lokiarchaeota archaeon]|nr:hypothetical protein [Candidatus Lokiarchaeota archaeon]